MPYEISNIINKNIGAIFDGLSAILNSRERYPKIEIGCSTLVDLKSAACALHLLTSYYPLAPEEQSVAVGATLF